MAAKSLEAASIWKTLSKIDCSGKTMEKGGLTYLPWNQAVTYMMDHYPEYTVKWHGTKDENDVTRDVTYYEGGTAMVNCSVTIGEVKRECWLPVMDYKNKAIAHPSSRDISDTKQRCLVKCFALFGLGIYIYRGDSVPDVEESVTPVAAVTPPKQKAKAKAKAKPKALKPEEAEVSTSNGAISDNDMAMALKEACNKAAKGGWIPDTKTQGEIRAALKSNDAKAIAKLLMTVNELSQVALKLHNEGEEHING
jgi:hypothetical protein